jgi:uncharacterized protein YndB with AHSA1/START domain
MKKAAGTPGTPGTTRITTPSAREIRIERIFDAPRERVWRGFEGRYREVSPPERLVWTFEWDGMPGHVAVDTVVLEDLGDGRTRLVSTSLFFTTEERDGALGSGMEEGLEDSYAALDRLLARHG